MTSAASMNHRHLNDLKSPDELSSASYWASFPLHPEVSKGAELPVLCRIKLFLRQESFSRKATCFLSLTLQKKPPWDLTLANPSRSSLGLMFHVQIRHQEYQLLFSPAALGNVSALALWSCCISKLLPREAAHWNATTIHPFPRNSSHKQSKAW